MVAGEAKSDLWWLIMMVVVLGLAWFVSGGPSRPFATGGPFLEPPASLGQGGPAPLGSGEAYFLDQSDGSPWSWSRASNQGPDLRTSSRRDQITLRSGNARYEGQANLEYLTIEASYSNDQPINISGWRLVGGAGSFTIPRGTKLLRGDGVNRADDPIILEPGGRAVVTSGWFPPIGPFAIEFSFQVNRCFGYVEALPNVQFTPSVGSSCPRGEDEPWLGGLTDECFEFVTRWPSCQTPKFERRSDGYDYINGRRDTLSSQCREFIKSHFNYQGCVAYHQAEPDFFTKDWRVFLKHSGELWDEQRETISLYDNQGQLVDQISY